MESRKMTPRLIQSRPVAAALFVSCVTLAVSAHAALVGIGGSDTAFRAVGPGGLKIDGKGAGVTAQEVGGVLVVTAPVNGLKTGMSLRDDHLKKAIHADKHPAMKLSVERGALKFPADNQTVTEKATGKFTLNGVTKELPFEYKAKRTGSDYHVDGRATINITDFGIEQPCYLGVCVDKTVQIKASFKLRER